MTDDSSVSVVIPCYNGAEFLGSAIESALGQSHAPIEVIVVDDGSTDASARIAKSFGPSVRLIGQKNSGESIARNRGIDESQGNWVAFLDADDMWESEKLAAQLAVATTSPDVICVYTDHFRFAADGQREADIRPEHHQADDHIQMICQWSIVPSSALVKRSIAASVRFPEWTRDSEDMIFFAALRRHGKFIRVARPLTGYRRSQNQQTSASHHKVRSALSRIRWVEENSCQYSIHDCDRIRRFLHNELAKQHSVAYWKRDFETVRICRQAMREFDPTGVMQPALAKKRLYPAVLLRAKDAIDACVRILSFR